METKYLDICEISEKINLNTRKVISLIRSGKLKGYLFGSEYRVGEEDLKSYIRRSRVMPDRIDKLANGFKVKLFDLVSEEGVSLSDASKMLEKQNPDGFLAYQYQNGAVINAGKQLDEMVSAKMKSDSSLGFTKAFHMACDENPVLAIIYQEELRP